MQYENKNTQKPTFDAEVEEINGEYKITISNIQYNGYIDKWEVKYQKEGQDYWSTSEDLSFFLAEGGIYKIKIINGNVESEEKTISIT